MYQPDYTFDSRHNPKSAFEKVLKAAGVPLLEVEINEMQDIQNTLRSKLFRELLTSGFMNMVPATVDGNKIRTGRMFALIDGNPVEVSDTSITLPSPPSSGARDDLVILEAWRQVVTRDDTITENGGEDTNVIENGIVDERLDVETSRRVQWRWRIRVIENATSVDSPAVGAYQKQYEGEEIYVANDPSTYDGVIYALPLFVVNRSGSLTLDQITDLRPKAELKQLDLSPVEKDIEDLINLIDQYKTTLEETIDSVRDTLSEALSDHVSDTKAHGASVSATPDSIALRDSQGRLKASPPSAQDDVVRKQEIDDLASAIGEDVADVNDAIGSLRETIQDLENLLDQYKATLEQAIDSVRDILSEALSDHISDTKAHGASVSATPDSIALRDSQGRLKASPPSAQDDVVRKQEIDDLVLAIGEDIEAIGSLREAIQDLENLLNQYKTTLEQAIEAVESDLSQNLTNHINSTAVHGATSEATANRIAMRDSQGRLKAAKPVDDDHVARYKELKDLNESLSAEIQSVSNDLESHKASGDHDDRYYTKTQGDQRYAPIQHQHDDRYYTKTQGDQRYAPIQHQHVAADLPKASTSQEGIVRLTNDRTSQSETLALTARAMNDHRLSGDHDDRYYTETEIDAMLAEISSTNIKPEAPSKYSANQRPREYPEGVSVHFATTNKGFPSSGTVLTVRRDGNDDRGAMQLLIPYGDGVLRYRLGIQNSPYWTEWRRLDTFTDLTVTGTLRIPVS